MILVLTLGCLEKIETASEDSGTASGKDGGGADARPGADAGVDGGQGDLDGGQDGGSPRDGGDGDAGEPDAGAEPPPLTFGMMQLPQGQVTITTIWGRSSSEIYAGTTNGNVLHFDPQQGWAVAWHEPNNFGIRRIRGTADRIFVASDTTLWVHDGPLGDAPTSYGVGQLVEDMHVVRDDLVFLVAAQVNGRGVYRFDGAQVETLNDQLAVAALYGVHVDPGGEVIVSGNGKIFRFGQLTWTEDVIDWPPGFSAADIANFDLYDVTRVGDRLFVVGDEQHVLEYDEPSSQWRYAYEPANADQPLLAMAPLSEEEAYAVGWPVAGGPIVRYSGGDFSSAGHPGNHTLHDLWVASPDEVYFVGNVRSTFDPVILRGTR